MRAIILGCCSRILLRAIPLQQTIAASPAVVLCSLRLNSQAANASELWGTKKQHRKVKLNFPLDMTDPKIENELAPLRASVKEQVRYPNDFLSGHVHSQYAANFYNTYKFHQHKIFNHVH